jgi:hypothetical protein
MRLYSKKKGWTLSDHGLCPVLTRDLHGVKLAVGESVSCHSEEEVFWALGLDYKLPQERSTLDTAGGSGAGGARTCKDATSLAPERLVAKPQ